MQWQSVYTGLQAKVSTYVDILAQADNVIYGFKTVTDGTTRIFTFDVTTKTEQILATYPTTAGTGQLYDNGIVYGVYTGARTADGADYITAYNLSTQTLTAQLYKHTTYSTMIITDLLCIYNGYLYILFKSTSNSVFYIGRLNLSTFVLEPTYTQTPWPWAATYYCENYQIKDNILYSGSKAQNIATYNFTNNTWTVIPCSTASYSIWKVFMINGTKVYTAQTNTAGYILYYDISTGTWSADSDPNLVSLYAFNKNSNTNGNTRYFVYNGTPYQVNVYFGYSNNSSIFGYLPVAVTALTAPSTLLVGKGCTEYSLTFAKTPTVNDDTITYTVNKPQYVTYDSTKSWFNATDDSGGQVVTITAASTLNPAITATTTVTIKTPAIASGSGTEADPYIITNGAELSEVRYAANKYHKQANNIDLASYTNWDPIGSYDYVFSGHYDGQNFEVQNMAIATPMHDRGLFGYTYNATISNVKVINVNIQGNDGNGYDDFGALIGCCVSSTVTNCHSSGTISGDGSGLGGLIGYVPNVISTIDHCSSSVNVYALDRCGGLIGNADRVNVYDSYCSGNIYITGATGGNNYIGGFIGYACGGTIQRCYCTGNITGSWPTDVTNPDSMGGFAGYLSCMKDENGVWIEVSVIECYSTGNITLTGMDNMTMRMVGLFCGYTDTSTITRCFSKGILDIGCKSELIGGFIGYLNSADITDCYTIGTIKTTLATDSIGGFAGYLDGSVSDPETIVRCYSAVSIQCTVAPTALVAGFASADQYTTDTTVTDCCYDSTVSGKSDTTLGTVPKPTTDMKTQSTYPASWDFTNVWGVDITGNNGYPNLKVFIAAPPETHEMLAKIMNPHIELKFKAINRRLHYNDQGYDPSESNSDLYHVIVSEDLLKLSMTVIRQNPGIGVREFQVVHHDGLFLNGTDSNALPPDPPYTGDMSANAAIVQSLFEKQLTPYGITIDRIIVHSLDNLESIDYNFTDQAKLDKLFDLINQECLRKASV